MYLRTVATGNYLIAILGFRNLVCILVPRLFENCCNSSNYCKMDDAIVMILIATIIGDISDLLVSAVLLEFIMWGSSGASKWSIPKSQVLRYIMIKRPRLSLSIPHSGMRFYSRCKVRDPLFINNSNLIQNLRIKLKVQFDNVSFLTVIL